MRDDPDGSVAPYVFFIDRSLGSIVVPQALQHAGVHVEIHDSHFAPNTPDPVWLSHVGQQGWIVLMKDKHIRSRPHERQALIYAGVRAFVLVSGNLKGPEMGENFVNALPAMYNLLRQRETSFIAQITRQGRISTIYPHNPL